MLHLKGNKKSTGLAITKTLMDKHNGLTSAKSLIGNGFQYLLLLPVEQKKDMLKIMLAEDDVDDREFFYSFLKDRTDIELLPTVESGVELLEYLGKVEDSMLPDVIILDQNMPKLNGLQTLSLLKSIPRYIHIPVMMYTTYAEERLIQNSTDAGAIIAMEKPTTEEEYNEMLDRFIRLIGGK